MNGLFLSIGTRSATIAAAVVILMLIPVRASAGDLEVLFSFGSGPSSHPSGGLVKGTDFRYYGSTYGPPRTLYGVNVTGSGYATLHTFSGNNYVFGRLMQASDWKLYGALQDGSFGRIFRIDTNGSNYQDIAVFTELSAAQVPTSAPFEASNGKLYGTLSFGGVHGKGGIYRMDKDGGNFSVIFPFSGTGIPFFGSALNSSASLIEADNGTIYGTTHGGGIHDRGVLFGVTGFGTGYFVAHHFQAGEGATGEKSGLIQASDGRLYGVTRLGGLNNNNAGTLYGVDLDGGNFSVLRHFSYAGGGQTPTGELIEADDGRLYGVCSIGGVKNGPTPHSGVVYRIKPDGSAYSVVHQFGVPNSPGGSPRGTLIPQGPGKFLGIAREGQFGGIFYRLTAPQQAPALKAKNRVRGKAGASRAKIRGTASDDIAVAGVFCKVRGNGVRQAKGTNRWRFKLRLKKKRTLVRIISQDFDDNVSPPKRVVVLRK